VRRSKNYVRVGTPDRDSGLAMFSASRVVVEVGTLQCHHTGLGSPLLQGRPSPAFHPFPSCRQITRYIREAGSSGLWFFPVRVYMELN
jgi:hypothetical protein